MGAPTRPRCSDASRLRDDPLIGTAPPAMQWLLVEQDSGWGREALTSLDAPASVRSHLERAMSESGTRLQLIRRTGRRTPQEAAAPRRWFVVGIGTPGTVCGGTLDDGWAPVIEALHAPEHGPTDEGQALDPSARVPTTDDTDATEDTDEGFSARPAQGRPRFVLVCTNGRHDMCCAVRGRPVAAALAARWPDDVWECTHTGGDRFAGNVVVLPEGVVYGSLDQDSAVAVLDAHHCGRLTHEAIPRHLRGFVGFRPVEQAARAVLTPHLSEVGLPPWDRESVAAATTRSGDSWSVRVTLDGHLFSTVTGHDEIRPAQHLTCSATAVSRARVPVVDDVRSAL